MKTYALIGQRLGHSFSQRYFSHLFSHLGLSDHSYILHEMPSLEGLRQWVEQEEILGMNITVPYKQAIIPLLDRLDATAAAIGAVNCVGREGNLLVGYNTDAPAFLASLKPLLSPALRQGIALVMGSGGAARAISHALKQIGIEHFIVSRTPSNGQISYSEARQRLLCRRPHVLLINATPVGMYPNTTQCPWPWTEYPGEGGLAYDLTYNPSPTLFLSQAAAAGTTIKDGLEMLHLQADQSWAIWEKQGK